MSHHSGPVRFFIFLFFLLQSNLHFTQNLEDWLNQQTPSIFIIYTFVCHSHFVIPFYFHDELSVILQIIA